MIIVASLEIETKLRKMIRLVLLDLRLMTQSPIILVFLIVIRERPSENYFTIFEVIKYFSWQKSYFQNHYVERFRLVPLNCLKVKIWFPIFWLVEIKFLKTVTYEWFIEMDIQFFVSCSKHCSDERNYQKLFILVELV